MINEKPKSSIEKKQLNPDDLKRIEVGVKNAEFLAKVLDDAYVDPLVGAFFPEGGDAVTAVAGLYIIYEAKKAGMSSWELTKMLGRTGFDFLSGSIPIVGDVFDFFYKSNKKNSEILRKHFDKISQGVDMTRQFEEDLAQRDRTKERQDLRGKIIPLQKKQAKKADQAPKEWREAA